jgi:hypothetical protein
MFDPLGALVASLLFAMVAGIRLEWRENQRSQSARIKGKRNGW